MRNLFTSLRALGLLAAALALLVFGHAAQAANPLELNFWLSGPRYDGRVAECEAALPTIASQFQEKESKFWNSALAITGFGRIHETAFRPWQSDNIPRRYLQRRRDAERRQDAHRALLDHRGRRLCRLRPGRRMVRDRA